VFTYLNEKKEAHGEGRNRDSLKIGGKKKSKLKQFSIMMVRHLWPIYLIRESYAKFSK